MENGKRGSAAAFERVRRAMMATALDQFDLMEVDAAVRRAKAEAVQL